MNGYKGNNPNKPDVPWWLRQIRMGLRWRAKCTYEDKWPRWRQYYRGEWKPGVLPSNVFFKMVRTVVPRIYFRNPSVSITSGKPGVEGYVLSKLTERTDNKLIVQMGMKKQLKRQVQDTFMFGSGVGKLGFGSQFHATPESAGTTEAPLFRDGQESIEYNFDVQPNMPWYSRWPLAGYVLPAGCEWREDARWECFIVRRPVEDVKQDSRFKNQAELKPMLYNHELGTAVKGDERFSVEMVDLFEIRDKKTGKVFVLSPQLSDKELFIADDGFLELGIECGRFTVFNEDDERVWGVPDSQILEPLQLEMNEVKTMLMYHRRLSVIKALCKRGAISREEVEKMLSPDVLAIIWTEEDPERAVKIMQAADIPDAILKSEISLMNDIRETLGFSRNEFGEFQGGRESPTATEAQIVKLASEIRVDERRDMMADLLVETIQDINKLIFKYWTEEEVIEVAGPAGVPIWVSFKPEMLARGNYVIKVDPDQSVPETKELRQNKALALYERLKLNPLIDPVKLTQYLLHELHGVAFDDMIAGLPRGIGTQERPMNVNQFGSLIQNVARRAPALLENKNALPAKV